jgi:thiol-disulfide isomerase/thioredoxin
MKSFTLFSAMLAVSAALQAQQVKFSDVKPEAGKELSFTYDPAGTKLEKSTAVKCRVVTFSPGTYITDGPKITNIDLVKSGAVFKGMVPTTDSTTLVALLLSSDEVRDENPAGYYTRLLRKGKETAESYIGEASLLNTAGGIVLMKPNLPKAKAAYEKGFALNPALKKKLIYNYLAMNYRMDKVAGTSLIKEEIALLEAGKTKDEKDLILVFNLYTLLKDKEAAALAKTKVLQAYPAGTLAYNDDAAALNTVKDAKTMDAMVNTMISKYKLDMAKKQDTYKLSNLYYRLTSLYAKEKNTEKFNFYADQIAHKVSRAELYNSIAWPLAENNENTAFAADISKKSLDLLTAARDDEFGVPYTNKEEYLKSLDNTYGMYADTYALLLYRQGNFKDAIAYEDKSFAMSRNVSPDMNVRYVTYLKADGQFDKAYAVAEKLIQTGEATDSVKSDFKMLYSRLGKQGDYTAYVAKLQEASALKEKQEWLKKMIDMPAPAFTLANLKGEKVSLADFKGKTVIVDYWATWCGPCVASFPGMQKAIEKYKDNPDVVFLFINTWQNEENREQVVKDFMAANSKYKFNVLLDTKNKQDPSQYDVISQYKVDGIPTKFIIDGNGNIRFKAVGFSGSTDGVVKEIDMMVGLVAGSSQLAKTK